MAGLLIREYDNHRPEKNLRATVLGYRTNDPIIEVADGHVLGRRETDMSRFRILRVPGVSIESMRVFCEPETVEVISGGDPIDAEAVTRRAWCLDPALLPQARAREYASSGETVLRDDEFLQAMIYKPLRLTAWALGYRMS